MELFLELTRRCNLQCSHCLRGDAQGKDMPEHILWQALRTLGDWGHIGIGGGESAMSGKHLGKLRNALLQTGTYKGLDTFYLVTNGKRLINDDSTRNLLLDFPADKVYLHVSTDRWHDSDAESNFRELKDQFEWSEKVEVYAHGPAEEYNIINIGRSGRGKECELFYADKMLYVDIYGYVWGSCDLSYTFMKNNTDKAICYGNVITDSQETIIKNQQNLSDYLELKDIPMRYSEHNGGFTRQFIEENKVELKEAI